jgi:hypothetical protein
MSLTFSTTRSRFGILGESRSLPTSTARSKKHSYVKCRLDAISSARRTVLIKAAKYGVNFSPKRQRPRVCHSKAIIITPHMCYTRLSIHSPSFSCDTNFAHTTTASTFRSLRQRHIGIRVNVTFLHIPTSFLCSQDCIVKRTALQDLQTLAFALNSCPSF